MNASTTWQVPGDTSSGARSRYGALLESCDQAEFLTGYFSLTGLLLLEPPILHAREQGRLRLLRFFCPLGPDQTSGDCVRRLVLDLPWIEVYGVRRSVGRLVHAKMAIFTKGETQTVVCGSSNLTPGGLRDNWEVNVEYDASAGSGDLRSQIEALRGLALERITADNIKRYEKDLAPERRVLERSGDPPESPVEIRAVIRDLGGKARRRLIVEKRLSETGGGGQIQFPRRAFEDFFGTAARSVTLFLPDGARNLRLSVFANSTWRVNIRELADLGQAFVEFEQIVSNGRAIGYRVRWYTDEGFRRLERTVKWRSGGRGRRFWIG